jgi:hypothetical protein
MMIAAILREQCFLRLNTAAFSGLSVILAEPGCKSLLFLCHRSTSFQQHTVPSIFFNSYAIFQYIFHSEVPPLALHERTVHEVSDFIETGVYLRRKKLTVTKFIPLIVVDFNSKIIFKNARHMSFSSRYQALYRAPLHRKMPGYLK